MRTWKLWVGLFLGWLAVMGPFGIRACMGQSVAEAVAVGATIVDWGTAVNAVHRAYPETNPVLGRRPSLARVNEYNVVVLAAETFGVTRLPKPWRAPVWCFIAGMETYVVFHEYSIGLRFDVRF
jgi:hypothetical protein